MFLLKADGSPPGIFPQTLLGDGFVEKHRIESFLGTETRDSDSEPMPTRRLAQPGAVESQRTLARLLQSAREELSDAIREARGGTWALERFSGHVDELIAQIYLGGQARPDIPWAVLALGGYGRRHLCLHSDIDLLIVFDGPIRVAEERSLKSLLHPLWDLKLQVGHQVRELDELRRVERDNPEFLLAVLDARLLAGEDAVFERFRDLCHRSGTEWRAQALDSLLRLTEQRHALFSRTIYQLEPDVKEAPGALRDVTAIRSIAALADPSLTPGLPSGLERLDEPEDLLLRLRSILHLENGRNLNVLSHVLQEKAAELFGCPGSRSHQRVEALMSAYFHHARTISRLLDASVKATRSPRVPVATELVSENLELTADGVRFVDAARATLQPHTWLQAFQAAVDRNRHVSDEALSCIERHGDRYLPEEFFPTEVEQHQLLRFLRPRRGLYARLSEMHNCRLLGRMFPEFQKIYCRVIRDFYHKFTVDEHTLLTIRNLESLCDPKNSARERFATVLRELHSPDVLVLALLFHDVGKWKIENHAEESVRMVLGPLVRLQMPPDIIRTVEFLIRHHLQMSRVAFRRDTDDPEVVRQFANLVGTETNLKMLCLMTLVDVEAVSPETLTPWKEELLWQLYVDTYNHMTRGYGDEVIDRNEANLARLQAARPPDISESEIGAFLEGLPQRYLQLVERESVYRHVRLSRNIRPAEVHCSLEQTGDIWELSVVTLDKPHLFSNICGVLSYFGMDILRGQAMTSPSGLVLDIFQFTDQGVFFRLNVEATLQFSRLLEDVVAGRTDLSATLRGKEQGMLAHRGPARVNTVVHFDNEHSPRYTTVEIVAEDAWGLLYRVSRVISEQGCDIDLVLISTEGHKAIDVFHITKGQAKLTDAEQLTLKADLEEMLGS